jgi:N-acetylglutamate synthase-like GNAT family acetyltransferase
MPEYHIRPLRREDQVWVNQVMITEWGAEIIVVHDEVIHPCNLPGFVASLGKKPVGLLTYKINGSECEITTLNSWYSNHGVGSTLIKKVEETANRVGCKRLFLVTTNNNTYALHFYQKWGFHISAVRINAIERSRQIKPEIPLEDEKGIAIRDEFELEKILYEQPHP